MDVIKATAGALLHDIGKVVQRAGGLQGTHSEIGARYLKECGISDEDILDCVLYHHCQELPLTSASKYAYIVNIADHVASQERPLAAEDYKEKGWNPKASLQSVFNLLKGSSERHYYKPVTLDAHENINYPISCEQPFESSFYNRIAERLTKNLNKFEFSKSYVNSLLELTETILSFIPSDTSKDKISDLSLYDHMKLTAAIAGCITLYILDEKEIDFEHILHDESNKFYRSNFAILYSADLSGIQKFIYTIHSSDALKSLRSRSFYLELFMENLIDEILNRIGLTRANLLYSGGGHFYMLLPNTDEVKCGIGEVIANTNKWLLKNFRTDLFVADGYCECSANDLQNKPMGSYRKLFIDTNKVITKKKAHRYSAEDIMSMNNHHVEGKECKICKIVGETEKGNCSLCNALIDMSGFILNQYKGNDEDVFFMVSEKLSGVSVPINEGLYFATIKKNELDVKLKSGSSMIRFYPKNTFYIGKNLSTRLWVGDYCKEKEISKYAEQSGGIGRIGILRMDVDNLGRAFTEGFIHDDGKYNTISRTATFSRHLSMFFKRSINMLLKKSDRAITVVYSGGDDMFLLGAWDDIIKSAIEIRNAFKQYTQGKLTLSAGIGIYSGKYPVHVMARETGDLEYAAKSAYDDKDAIALFSPDLIFKWDEFINHVYNEKYELLKSYFNENREKGNSFLYKILSYIQGVEEEEKDGRAKISLARYAYLLARTEPSADENADKKEKFKQFSKSMYGWLTNKNDRKQLKVAIYLYVYSTREGKGDGTNERK